MTEQEMTLVAQAVDALGEAPPLKPDPEDIAAFPASPDASVQTAAECYRKAQARRMMRLAAAYWRERGEHLDFVSRLEDGLEAE